MVCRWDVGCEGEKNKETQKAERALSPGVKSPATTKEEGMSKNKTRQEQKEAGRLNEAGEGRQSPNHQDFEG